MVESLYKTVLTQGMLHHRFNSSVQQTNTPLMSLVSSLLSARAGGIDTTQKRVAAAAGDHTHIAVHDSFYSKTSRCGGLGPHTHRTA